MKKLIVRVGNGNKEHIGREITRDGRVIGVAVSCGSRRMGTSKMVIREADLATYAGSLNSCEKCAERVSA